MSTSGVEVKASASPFDYISGQAPLQVVTRTLVAGTAAAGVGSLIGLRRNIPAIPAAFTTALSSGVFAFAFFSFREYLAIPATRYLRHEQFLTATPNPHTANIIQSGLSGAGAGALLVGYARGGRKLIPGTITFALGCSVLQLAINEIYLMRLAFLTRDTSSIPSPIESHDAPSFKSHLLAYLPVRKIDDKEYAAALKKQLEECSSSIEELDAESAQLKKNPHSHKV